MDSSIGNLISLSDSRSETPKKHVPKLGGISGGDFSPVPHTKNVVDGNEEEVGLTGLLVDLNDAVEVSIPQSIMTQAEVDDTFGIFSRPPPQISQEAGEQQCKESCDEASKLVSSFTSGSKSEVVDKDKNKIEQETAEVAECEEKDCDNSLNSSQATIVSEDSSMLRDIPDVEDVIEQEPKEACEPEPEVNLEKDKEKNISVGSDSEFLDVNNLSSFSIPSDSLDENKYLEDIKKEDMARTSVSAAIIQQIKQEFELYQQEETDADATKDEVFSNPGGDYLADLACPSLNSSISTRARLSTVSSISSVGGNRLSFTHGFTAPEDSEVNSERPKRSRISNTIGSPIRASYPVPSKYMPTPKSQTPNRQIYTPRDRLSESLSSPTRTRVFLHSGRAPLSPSRVPVRKSISAETLYFTQSPVGAGHQMKFSTPNVSRSRYSFRVVGEDARNGTETHDRDDVFLHRPLENKLTDEDIWAKPRNNRLSCSSVASTETYTVEVESISSINDAPSPDSAIIKREREISLLSKQMIGISLNGTRGRTHASGRNENVGGRSTSGIQPLRAMAAVPITKVLDTTISDPHNTTVVRGRQQSTVGSSAQQQKYIPPIASSSPKAAAGRPGSNPTTPSRSRYTVNARSSGYGQQNLNLSSSFSGMKPPLTSPNRIASSSTTTVGNAAPASRATVKPAIIPIKGGIPSLGAKTRPGLTTTAGKLPQPKSGINAGALRRPATTAAAATSVNKENGLRPTTRIGLPSRLKQ